MESLAEANYLVARSRGGELGARRAAAQAGEFLSISRSRSVAIFSSNREFWLHVKIPSDLSKISVKRRLLILHFDSLCPGHKGWEGGTLKIVAFHLAASGLGRSCWRCPAPFSNPASGEAQHWAKSLPARGGPVLLGHGWMLAVMLPPCWSLTARARPAIAPASRKRPGESPSWKQGRCCDGERLLTVNDFIKRAAEFEMQRSPMSKIFCFSGGGIQP